MVAAAAIGGAVIGGVATGYAGDQSADAIASSADSSSAATLAATQMQIEEAQRQFDTQIQILTPMLEQQYGASNRLGELLGLTPQSVNYASAAQNNPYSSQDYSNTNMTQDQASSMHVQPDGSVRPGSTGNSFAVADQATQNAMQGRLNRFGAENIPSQAALSKDNVQSSMRGAAERWTHPDTGKEFIRYSSPNGQDVTYTPYTGQKVEAKEYPTQQSSSQTTSGKLSLAGMANRDAGYTPQANTGGRRSLAGQAALEQEVAQITGANTGTQQPQRAEYRTPVSTDQGTVFTQSRAGEQQSTNYGSTSNGFYDPNLSSTRLGYDSAAQSERGKFALSNTLASVDPDSDYGRNYVASNNLYDGMANDSMVQHVDGSRLAGGSMYDDERFNFARDTNIAGNSFQASDGYNFMLEEAQRELDRKNSAGGGNYGGRALLEAQRRSQGLASTEYYNWANLRQNDLSRQDAAASAYQDNQRYDVSRSDAAVSDARRREELDVARNDAALTDYYSRRGGDIARQDSAIAANDANRAYDLQRQDQGYYNYLNQVAGMAGVGTQASEAVAASQAASGTIANAYANQGNALSSIYANQGNQNVANINNTAENFNNVAQGSISNYLTYQQLQSA